MLYFDGAGMTPVPQLRTPLAKQNDGVSFRPQTSDAAASSRFRYQGTLSLKKRSATPGQPHRPPSSTARRHSIPPAKPSIPQIEAPSVASTTPAATLFTSPAQAGPPKINAAHTLPPASHINPTVHSTSLPDGLVREHRSQALPAQSSRNQPIQERRPTQAHPEALTGNAETVCHAANRNEYREGLRERLLATPHSWQHRHDWQRAIGQSVLEQSKTMDGANFRRIHQLDLERMAAAYDQLFFEGTCLPLARSFGMSFRLSPRMTRAGGKTTRHSIRAPDGRMANIRYEIAVSTNLLFQSFRKRGDRTRVCGLLCQDRLTALQRVVEHELIHLSEMLVWIQSDCAAQRFQSISNRLFGHTEHRHELVTPTERAAREFDIRLGSHVQFELQGRTLKGIVNRITSRATILVPDPSGPRYNDGRHYVKVYVPIHRLRRIV